VGLLAIAQYFTPHFLPQFATPQIYAPFAISAVKTLRVPTEI
jgi:hypothetical protein